MNEASSAIQPTTIVIFGASGDLTQRKLVPALFSLYRKHRLPADFRILGFAATPWSDAEFRAALRAGVDKFADYKFASAAWDEFAARLSYHPGSFTALSDYEKLAARLKQREEPPRHDRARPGATCGGRRAHLVWHHRG